jgi:catalase-peroxidase
MGPTIESNTHVQTHPLEEGVTGRGTGLNTFTAGFEGPWTETPTDWDNEYFTNLLAFDWRLETGPGGADQCAFCF